MQTQSFLGIDVSKATLDACLLFTNAKGVEKSQIKKVTNNVAGFKELTSWAEEKCGEKPHVCMEATGCYMEEFAEFLDEAKFPVSVMNPLQIKAFAKSTLARNKTDKADARIIADFCKERHPALWRRPPAEFRGLRDIMRARDNFLKLKVAEKNKLGSRIVNEEVKKLINETVEFLQKKIKKLEQMAEELISENNLLAKQVQHLMSIKGIGFATACQIIANMPPVEFFENAEQYSAYAGTTPSNCESGTSVKKRAHLSKIGAANVRKALYMPAIVVKNKNEAFQNFVEKHQKAEKPEKSIVCIVMRKLMRIIYGMLKNDQDFDATLAFATR